MPAFFGRAQRILTCVLIGCAPLASATELRDDRGVSVSVPSAAARIVVLVIAVAAGLLRAAPLAALLGLEVLAPMQIG